MNADERRYEKCFICVHLRLSAALRFFSPADSPHAAPRPELHPPAASSVSGSTILGGRGDEEGLIVLRPGLLCPEIDDTI